MRDIIKITIVLLAFSALPAFGTVRFLNSAASGSGNGSTWANGYVSTTTMNTASSGWAAGDTVCIAGATYGGQGIVPAATGTSGNPITYKRATAADSVCGSSTAGWNSAFDALVTISNGALLSNGLTTNYITITGTVSGGMAFTIANVTGGGPGLGVAGPSTGSILSYVDIGQTGCGSSGCNQNEDTRGIDLNHFNGSSYDLITNMLIDHVNVHGECTLMWTAHSTGLIIQNSRFADSIDNTPGNPHCHPNVMASQDTAGGTFRFNEVTNWQVEGIMTCPTAACSSAWDIYGNVWHDPTAGSFPRVYEAQNSTCATVHAYNNTIVAVPFATFTTSAGGNYCGGSQGRNNIYISSSGSGLPSNDFDAFNGSTGGETNGQNIATSIFVNFSAKTVAGYALASNTAAGTTLASPFATDLNGTVRGVNGTWDRGYYQIPAAGTTWYVNASGGNRFSVNVTAGQCDGQSPAPYPGTGVNQHCAFNDIRYLWTDGTFTNNVNAGSPKWGWIGAGGDTYLIDCNGMTGNSCRIGQSGPNSGDSFGLNGDPYSAGAPFPPAGSSGAHTRILGINYASCSSPSAKTVVNGGYGTNWAFVTNSFLDIQCIEITDHSICSKASSLTTNPCSTSFPLDDYTSEGLQLFRGFTNVTIKDVYIHGTAHDCMGGPTGDATVLTNVNASGCPSSTWNMDPGDGTTGTGSLAMNNVNLAFSGFAEVYPVVPANNITLNWGTVGQVGDGTDQLSGGYGDCIGTTTVTSSPAWLITVNGGSCSYATQDGYDFLHLTGGGSRINLNGVFAYGNMGQQIKLGSAGSVINSLIVGNCNAQRFIPGLAAHAADQLSNWCRAGDMALYVAVANGSVTNVQFNTIYSAEVIAVGVTNQSSPPCSDATCVLNFKDNVTVAAQNSVVNGYTSAQATDKLSNPMFVDATSPYPFGGSTYDHNSTFYLPAISPPVPATTCPNTLYSESNALCTSPQLTDMSWHLYGYGNMAPASGSSAVVGAGVAISGITTDYNGVTRPSPPSIGALEFAAGPPTVATPTASPGAGTYTSTQSVTLSTSTGGATICYTTNGTTPAATTAGTCDGGSAAYSGAISVATTTTIKALGTLSGDTNSSVASFAYTITAPAASAVSIGGTIKFSGTVKIP